MGRRVSQILGRLTRSAHRIFGTNQQGRGEGRAKITMCPVCLGNLALLAAGVSSSSGLTAFAVAKLLKEKPNKQQKTK